MIKRTKMYKCNRCGFEGKFKIIAPLTSLSSISKDKSMVDFWVMQCGGCKRRFWTSNIE